MRSPLLSPGARPSSSNAGSNLPYVLLFCAFIALSGAFVNLQRCQSKLSSERELLRRVQSKLLLEARLAQRAALQREIDVIANGPSHQEAAPSQPEPDTYPSLSQYPTPQPSPDELEVWARGPNKAAGNSSTGPRQHLSDSEYQQLKDLCGRTLYHSLMEAVHMYSPGGPHAFVATGDIPDEWIRDSSVQLGVLLPRIAQHPALRQVVDAAILRQASFILADPWANSFRKAKVAVDSLTHTDRRIGRGGWVATRNFEVDSGAYFINLLWNYYHTPGLWGHDQLLNSSVVHDAVLTMISTWQTEQHHEEQSPYRYWELPRDGRGPLTGYTGMIWGGFRPSDDPQTHGYNIPANMYAAASLEHALWLNERLWSCPKIAQQGAQLAADIKQGIEQYGIIQLPNPEASRPAMQSSRRAKLLAGNGTSSAPPTVKIYAYEVDGLGNHLADFDDPNLPSLLAMPLLGYSGYDEQVYSATRDRIMSSANHYWFQGPLGPGCGSPHTPKGNIWPLGLMVEALTTNDTSHQAEIMQRLLRMQCGNGLMHESIDASRDDTDDGGGCTRPDFEWANSMLVALVEATLGLDCDAEAQRLHLDMIREREKFGRASAGAGPGSQAGGQHNGPQASSPGGASSDDYPLFYERLEQLWDLA